MRHLTIRNLPSEVGSALDREKKRRGVSLNQTVVDLLREGLGVGSAGPRSNGLRALAGRWTEAERARFDEAIEFAERVDEDLWR